MVTRQRNVIVGFADRPELHFCNLRLSSVTVHVSQNFAAGCVSTSPYQPLTTRNFLIRKIAATFLLPLLIMLLRMSLKHLFDGMLNNDSMREVDRYLIYTRRKNYSTYNLPRPLRVNNEFIKSTAGGCIL